MDAKDYSLFLPVEKRYIEYKDMQKRIGYIEQLFFNNIEEFEEFFERVQKDPHAREMTASYRKKIPCILVQLQEIYLKRYRGPINSKTIFKNIIYVSSFLKITARITA